MDVLTHLFLPYAAALLAFGLHRPSDPASTAARPRFAVDPRPAAGAALVFGVASMAPDIDGLYSLAKNATGLWWLQHRGFSHSVIGAPLHAFVLVGVLHLLAVYRPRRFGSLRFRPVFVPLALIGSWTHLLLDGVTYAGTPAFFPFSDTRVSFPVFHWLVIWMVPLWVLFFAVKTWRRWGPEWTVRAGAVALVILVVVAGIRLAAMPDVDDDAIVLPRTSMFEWTVLQPHDNGTWEAYLLRGDVQAGRLWYEDQGPRDDAAKSAIATARQTDAYKGYKMGLFGPEVINVTRGPADTIVTFTSVAQHFEVESGLRWTPAEPMEAWGVVSLRLGEDGIEIIQNGW